MVRLNQELHKEGFGLILFLLNILLLFQLFTVFYGFLGVPFTVIIFTNFGRYLQKLERYSRKQFWRRWRLLLKKRKTSQTIRKELSF